MRGVGIEFINWHGRSNGSQTRAHDELKSKHAHGDEKSQAIENISTGALSLVEIIHVIFFNLQLLKLAEI